MKKIMLSLGLAFCLLSVTQVNAAPILVLDDVDVTLGQTSLDIKIFIDTDASKVVDSATFTLTPIAGFTLADVSFSVPSGWSPAVNISKGSFGATDFGYPANVIDSSMYEFATMTFTFAADFFNPWDNLKVDFDYIELSNEWATTYSNIQVKGGTVSAVPIPGAVWLLGSGLVGLVATRRKKKNS